MTEDMETTIRKVLDEKAHEVEVPEGLAERTLAVARESQGMSFRERFRAWRDGRRVRAPVTGYPRWLYATGAAATAVMLFAVGTLVTTAPIGPVATDDMPRFVPGAAETTTGAGATGAEPAPDAMRIDQAAGDAPAMTGPDVATRPGIEPVPPISGPIPGPGRPGAFPPRVIRTADVQIEVSDFGRAWSRAANIATRNEGFVTNSSTEQVDGRLGRGTLTMRVPAARLDAVIAELEELGTVAFMQTSGSDVSGQIVDLQARLRSLESEELQLLELLRQARNLSETLEVRSRLDAVRQQIESLRAQQEYFENQVDFSTVTATIFEPGADFRDPSDDGILLDALRTALRVGLTIVAGAMVVLGGLIPLALLGVAVWLIVRAVRRRSA